MGQHAVAAVAAEAMVQFIPATTAVWLVAKNDRGGGVGAVPTVRVVNGLSLLNDGFSF